MMQLPELIRVRSFLLLILLLLFSQCDRPDPYAIEGEMMTWHTLTLSFPGPRVSENDVPNPFLDYRLMVSFSRDGDTIRVPGFFAADGNASESSATEGNIWQVRFKPPAAGQWDFLVSFRRGHNIAVNEDPNTGTPDSFDGLTGTLDVAPSNKTGRDFRAQGRLDYVNERYLRFAGSGAYFLKGGTDSPENFLAYHEFDGTRYGGSHERRMGEDHPNADLHRYEPHIKDWKEGDPLWQGKKGKGIIGAVNYLSSKGMNSIYFLTMNVLGDGEDVWPWTDREERYRFDCSKLDQWEIVFEHMEQLGVMMHVVLQETENECLLDAGRLDVQRKLYLRELIARFGHHLAVTWNIGEENGPVVWSPVGQTVQDRKEMMSYIKRTDPYPCFVVVHTHSTDPDHSRLIEPFLGFPDMDGPSLQLSPPALVHEYTKKWIESSRAHAKPWVVCSDELGPAWMGIMPDAADPHHDTIRKEALWGNLIAGGAGVEWYFGYNFANGDLNCEDWRSRDRMWDQTRYALTFFQQYLPFPQMESHDELTSQGSCLALPGRIYAVYLPEGGTATLDLSGIQGQLNVEWFDPRNGGPLQKGSIMQAEGGGPVSIGLPPDQYKLDWVCLIRAVSQ